MSNDNDKDIRLIIRVGRQIKVKDAGVITLYSIRGIVDLDHVVVRHFVRNRWHYKLIGMKAFEIWYKEGKLS